MIRKKCTRLHQVAPEILQAYLEPEFKLLYSKRAHEINAVQMLLEQQNVSTNFWKYNLTTIKSSYIFSMYDSD